MVARCFFDVKFKFILSCHTPQLVRRRLGVLFLRCCMAWFFCLQDRCDKGFVPRNPVFVDVLWALIGIPKPWCSAIPWRQVFVALRRPLLCSVLFLLSKIQRWFWEGHNTGILRGHAKSIRLQIWRFCISVRPNQDGRASGNGLVCIESHDWTETSEPVIPVWCSCSWLLTCSDVVVLW